MSDFGQVADGGGVVGDNIQGRFTARLEIIEMSDLFGLLVRQDAAAKLFNSRLAISSATKTNGSLGLQGITTVSAA